MGEARLRYVNRSQTGWRMVDVESLIGAEHNARAIWDLVTRQPVEGFLKENKSVAGKAGADRIDPHVLISVWVYGLTLGIGSARELSRRMEQEPGLRWLSGDEAINAHTLSDFRVEHGAALDQLFSQVLAAISEAGLVKLEQLTLDGTKIQAQASASSLRREPRLRERLQQAQEVVAQLKEEGAQQEQRRKTAAQRRAAREVQARLEKALEALEEIRRNQPPEEIRVSMSEPEARVMKNGQGGFAPSYNVQSVIDAAHKIVVDVEVSTQPNDQHLLEPALERMESLLKDAKPQLLIDGGYLNAESIAAAEPQVELIGPGQDQETLRERNREQSLKQAGIDPAFGAQAFQIVEQGAALQCPAGQRLERISKAQNYDRYQVRAADGNGWADRMGCCTQSGQRSVKIKRVHPVVDSFHQRMQGEECKNIYRRRGEIAEFAHAWWKDKFGLRKFHVRGLAKVRMEMKWAALAYNIQQWARLIWRPALAALA